MSKPEGKPPESREGRPASYEQSFFDRQLQAIAQEFYRSYTQQFYLDTTQQFYLDTATGTNLEWLVGLLEPPATAFDRFITLTKKIVEIWAENLPDLTKRTAMLELHPTPLAR